MAGLKELKKRIKSTQSIGKIMGAMKMISASRLSSVRSRVDFTKSYVGVVDDMMSDLYAARNLDNSTSEISSAYINKNPKSNSALIIVIGSDRGLCGGYNNNINRAYLSLVASLSAVDTNVITLPIGSKMIKYMKGPSRSILHGENLNEFFTADFKSNVKFIPWKAGAKTIDFEVAQDIATYVWELFYDSKVVDSCYVVSSSFKNMLKQEPKVHKILPFEPREAKTNVIDSLPVASRLIDNLVIEHLSTLIYGIWFDALLSEHASRMTAMDNASNNAKEMKKQLTLKYNRTRQALVTKELNEIVAGAEAV